MSSAPRSFAKASPRERITQIVEGWFLTEPLLFAAWTMHDVVEHPQVETIRVGRGKVEFNAEFIASLRRADLRAVLTFEAMRILLGHPYSRRQPNAELSYLASNVTVQECLRTSLPMPRARDVFQNESFDDQYFEFYYRELEERSENQPDESPPDHSGDSANESDQGPGNDAPAEDENTEDHDDQGNPDEQDSSTSDSLSADSESEARAGETAADSTSPSPNTLDSYTDAASVGAENTADWDNDDLQRDEINAAVREAAETGGWGSVGGAAREKLLATLRPKLDYRGVLRNFRQSVVSVRRRLTRMKPSRRYGFDQMGSRYDFTTKLLFAVDVSGSMGKRDLQLGFSVVSRFFQYGVESVDVIWFDEEIRCEPLTLRKARAAFDITGRGGTNFSPVIEYIETNRDYDGLIVYTDGYAPVPKKPKNTRTRILWLFKDESTYDRMGEPLRPLGRSAFLKESARTS